MNDATVLFLQGLGCGLGVGIVLALVAGMAWHLRRVRELSHEFRRILHEPTP